MQSAPQSRSIAIDARIDPLALRHGTRSGQGGSLRLALARPPASIATDPRSAIGRREVRLRPRWLPPCLLRHRRRDRIHPGRAADCRGPLRRVPHARPREGRRLARDPRLDRHFACRFTRTRFPESAGPQRGSRRPVARPACLRAEATPRQIDASRDAGEIRSRPTSSTHRIVQAPRSAREHDAASRPSSCDSPMVLATCPATHTDRRRFFGTPPTPRTRVPPCTRNDRDPHHSPRRRRSGVGAVSIAAITAGMSSFSSRLGSHFRASRSACKASNRGISGFAAPP